MSSFAFSSCQHHHSNYASPWQQQMVPVYSTPPPPTHTPRTSLIVLPSDIPALRDLSLPSMSLPPSSWDTCNEQCPSLQVWVPDHQSPISEFLRKHPGRQPIPRIPFLWGLFLKLLCCSWPNSFLCVTSARGGSYFLQLLSPSLQCSPFPFQDYNPYLAILLLLLLLFYIKSFC